MVMCVNCKCGEGVDVGQRAPSPAPRMASRRLPLDQAGPVTVVRQVRHRHHAGARPAVAAAAVVAEASKAVGGLVALMQ